MLVASDYLAGAELCLGRFLAFLFVRCWLIGHRHFRGLFVSFSLVASLYGVLPVM